MKQAIGDLWSRYVDQSRWQREGKDQVLEIAGFVIAIGPGIDDAERHVWRWSIYRGKAEWYSYLVEGVWSPIDYADENEARAVAWTMLLRTLDPKWPPEPEDVLEDMYDGSAP
jgi:hypothetical protein